jgi:hypothetical protein
MVAHDIPASLTSFSISFTGSPFGKDRPNFLTGVPWDIDFRLLTVLYGKRVRNQAEHFTLQLA